VTVQPKQTLPHVIRRIAAESPSRPALIHNGTTYSYGEVWGEASRAARALVHLGIGPGDRVGILFGNQPEWLVASVAACAAGAIAVPLNTWYKELELDWTLRHARISVLLSMDRMLSRDYAALISSIIPELSAAEPGSLKSPKFTALRAVVVTGAAPAGTFSWDEFLDLGRDVADLDARLEELTPSDTAFVLYTSGSTGEPKGAMLAHGNVLASGRTIGDRRQITADDPIWLGSALFYGLGATNALPVALTRAAPLVIHDFFDATRALNAIESSAAAVFYGTGNMAQAMLDHSDFSTARVRTLRKGNAGTMEKYKRLTLFGLQMDLATPAYGLTEAYGQSTGGWPDDPVEIKLSTDGEPLPGVEIQINGLDTERPVPRGDVGRIMLRGRVSEGYLGQPPWTGGLARTADGWIDTGDLGRIDDAGRVIFQSRLKEIIKSGGIGVSPIEIEQLLARHPSVRDAHVVSVPDAALGEAIVAFIESSSPVPEADLKAFVRERAASFKVPHHILFRLGEDIPRLASGKVAKLRLAEEAAREFAKAE